MTDREKVPDAKRLFPARSSDSVKAREQLEALVTQFPADSSAPRESCRRELADRDMARALELGRKASAIYPNNVLRRNNVALFAMYAGDFETAEKEAAGVLELNTDFAKAYLAMAVSPARHGTAGRRRSRHGSG